MQQFFLLIWVTLHVSTLRESPSGVSNYTLLITGLQREITIFLFTYTGHNVATLMFIYILTHLRLNIELNNFFLIKLKLILELI
jgi:hypothetical protein